MLISMRVFTDMFIALFCVCFHIIQMISIDEVDMRMNLFTNENGKLIYIHRLIFVFAHNEMKEITMN